MKVIGMSLIVFILSYIQLQKLVKLKKKKEIYVFLGFMAIATYLSVGKLLDLYIPNPTNGLKMLFTPINDWMNQLFS